MGWGCVAGKRAGCGRGAAAGGHRQLLVAPQPSPCRQVSSVGSLGLDVPLCAAEPGAGPLG